MIVTSGSGESASDQVLESGCFEEGGRSDERREREREKEELGEVVVLR
jgi:hypothetical protein